jgi:hypothetical protein
MVGGCIKIGVIGGQPDVDIDGSIIGMDSYATISVILFVGPHVTTIMIFQDLWKRSLQFQRHRLEQSIVHAIIQVCSHIAAFVGCLGFVPKGALPHDLILPCPG